MRSTLGDIAEQLNLSSSTVSRVLSGRGRHLISEATCERVLRVAKEMGYRPNRAARSLATGRTNMIALWLSDMRAVLPRKIAHCLQRELTPFGYEAMASEYGPALDRPRGEMGLTRWAVDGVVMDGGSQWYESFLKHHPPLDVPIVQIAAGDTAASDLVRMDLRTPAEQAMASLVKSGRKRIAHMLTTSTRFKGEGRYDAYCHVLKEVGQKQELVIVSEGTRPAARQAAKDYIAAHGQPDAFFCANDEMAIGTYRGLRDLGLSIPDDVALVGCDGIEDVEYLDTPISTIVIPVEQMCGIAWQFLRHRMEQPNAPMQKATIAAQFIERESTGGG